MNARVSRLTVLNPQMTGEINNGDSIEIQHRGTTNGVINLEMSRLDLRDPASANIKILEAQNPDQRRLQPFGLGFGAQQREPGRQPRWTHPAQRREQGLKAFTLAREKHQILGIRRGRRHPEYEQRRTAHGAGGKFVAVRLSQQTAGASPIAAVTVTHPADKTIGTAIIDLGGGSLGSRGRNRFVNNAGLDLVSHQRERRDGADQGRRIGQLLGRRHAGQFAVDISRRVGERQRHVQRDGASDHGSRPLNPPHPSQKPRFRAVVHPAPPRHD